MLALLVLDKFLDMYSWVLLIAIVMSWLVGFKVINLHNKFAYSAVMAIARVTEPVFKLFRRFIPAIGGLDISPIVVFLLIDVIRVAISSVVSS